MKQYLQTLTLIAVFVLPAGAIALAQANSPQERTARVAAESARQQQEQAAAIAARQAEETRRRQEQETAKLKAAYPLTALTVQVVIARFQGEKKVSSLPYVLSVNANSLRWGGKPALLRMGSQIPVPVGPPAIVDGKPSTNYRGSVEYKDIGTNIDATATSIDGGRFQVNISIEDSSVYADDPSIDGGPRVRNMPVFRSFRSSNELILAVGQTAQFTAATDRISGEIIKVDVTLNAPK